MAGDWIKWTKGFAKKQEVLQIAARMRIPASQAAGCYMQLAEWLDDNITSFDEKGNANVTLGALPHNFLDALAGADGFADALTAVGWLVQRNGSLVFPNLARHNGQTAKNRALTRERVAQNREKKKDETGNAPSVTGSSLLYSDQRGEVGGEKRPSSGANLKTNPSADDDTWLHQLAASEAYRGIDVPREFAKMKVWCINAHKQPTRRRFINWLNRCERPIASGVKSQKAIAEPRDWKAILNHEFPGSVYAANGEREAHEWDQLPPEAQKAVWAKARKDNAA